MDFFFQKKIVGTEWVHHSDNGTTKALGGGELWIAIQVATNDIEMIIG